MLYSRFTDKQGYPAPANLLHQYQQELRSGLLNNGLKLGMGFDIFGKPYSWILDCREILLHGQYLHYAGRLLWERLRHYQPEMVGGMTMSADPLTFALLYEAGSDNYPLTGFTIRKQPKTYGLRKLIEGPTLRPGTRVVILDDLISSGETLKKTLSALRPFQPEVVAIGAIVDFQHAGTQWLHAQKLPLEALFTLSDLGIAINLPSNSASGMLCWTWEVLNSSAYSAPKSGPCFALDTIFVGGDNGFLLALTQDGRERWRYLVRNKERGIDCSPLIYNGKVYFGAYDGYIYCLDASSGALLWEAQHGQWIGSSPAVDPKRNLVFVGTKYGKAGGSLVALEADTGRLEWELKASHYVHSSPWFDPYHHQVIVGSNNGIIYAADAATGENRWQFRTDGEVKGKPVVDENGICFVGSFDGFLYALEVESGHLQWKKRLSRCLYTNPLIYKDSVIVGCYSGHVVALERGTGTIRWVGATGSRIIGGAALVNDAFVAIGSTDSYVYLFDGDTGRILWRYKTGGPIRTTPGVNMSQFVIPSCDGKLYAFTC